MVSPAQLPLEGWWSCGGCVCSGWCWEWDVCVPATGVTGTGHTERASLISEPFLIRWKTMLSFLCSLSGSCTSNSVLKLTSLCSCSALSQLQLPREGECLPQHLVLVYEHVCEASKSALSVPGKPQWALLSFWMEHGGQTRPGGTAKGLL